MKTKFNFYLIWAVFLSVQNPHFSICFAGENHLFPGGAMFEGRIRASMTQGNQTEDLLYTIGTNFLRVELTATNWPNPADIVNRNSGELTLVFPNNSSFMRVKPVTHSETSMPGMPNAPKHTDTTTPPVMHGPEMPQLPPGIGPQSTPGVTPARTAPEMPMPMPPMSPAAMEKLELRDTNEKTNILGYACEHYEIKQRSQTMEIWATDQLGPFQSYIRNQPLAVSQRTMEEQWGALLKAKGVFPLLATLKFENGVERFRFEVKSVTPQNLTRDDLRLFQPPANYHEVRPLPF